MLQLVPADLTTKLRLFSLVIAVTLLLALPTCAPGAFKSYTYREGALDLERLTLTPVSPLRSGLNCPSDLAECYSRFSDATGRYQITHLARHPKSGGAGGITHHNFFFLSGDYRLIHRSKTQLLFSGAFGNVYAIVTFFYAPDYGRDPNTIEVRSYLSNAAFETPVEEDTVIPAEASLTAISLVRVFRHTPEFLVISADYTPAGGLSAFHVNATAGGVWTNARGASGRSDIDVGTTSVGDRSPLRRAFGDDARGYGRPRP